MFLCLIFFLAALIYSKDCKLATFSPIKQILDKHFDTEFIFCNRTLFSCNPKKTDLIPRISLNQIIEPVNPLQSNFNDTISCSINSLNKSISLLMNNSRQFIDNYNIHKCSYCVNFDNIPYQIKTALLSYVYDNQTISKEMLEAIYKNDWRNLYEVYPKVPLQRQKEAELIDSVVNCDKDFKVYYLYQTSNLTNAELLIRKDQLINLISSTNEVFTEEVGFNDKFPYTLLYPNKTNRLNVQIIQEIFKDALRNFRKRYINEIPQVVLLTETLRNDRYYLITKIFFKNNITKSELNQEIDNLFKVCEDNIIVVQDFVKNPGLVKFNDIINDIASLALWAIILLIIIPTMFAFFCCIVVCKWCCGPSYIHQREPALLIDRGNNYNL